MREIGSMLHQLGGGTPKPAFDYIGKKIKDAFLDGDDFRVDFEDGTKIKIWDNGQSCCESRYMKCDDNPKDLIGGVLKDIQVKEASGGTENNDAHEIAFLEVQTDKTSITIATHNEHNGYYGGFGLCLDEVK